jgi:hypothetical protein
MKVVVHIPPKVCDARPRSGTVTARRWSQEFQTREDGYEVEYDVRITYSIDVSGESTNLRVFGGPSGSTPLQQLKVSPEEVARAQSAASTVVSRYLQSSEGRAALLEAVMEGG